MGIETEAGRQLIEWLKKEEGRQLLVKVAAAQLKRLTAKELAGRCYEGEIERIIEEIEEQVLEKVSTTMTEEMRLKLLYLLEWELDYTPLSELYQNLRNLIEDFRERPERFI